MQEVLKRLLREPRRFIDIFFATFFMHLMGFAVILYSILVFNTYLPYGVTATLTALTLGCLLGLLIEFHFKGIRNSLMRKYYQDVVEKIAEGFFKKIMILPYEEIERSMNLLRNQAIDSILHLLRPSLTTATLLLLDIPFAFLFLLLLFLIHPILGLVSVIFILISSGFALYSRKKMAMTQLDARLSEQQLLNLYRAATEGVQTSRYTGQMSYIEADWSTSLKRIVQNSTASFQLETEAQRIPAFVIGVQSVLITAIGAILVFDGRISIGGLVGSNLLAAKVMVPVISFFTQFESFNKIDDSIRCLREIEQLSEERGNNTKFRGLSGSLSAREITYRYYRAPNLALEAISIEIQKNDIAVITGDSGSGKSTLLQILAGLRSPLDGAVYVEGVNLQQISKTWWRTNISYLPQDPTLTNGTLYQNLVSADYQPDEGELDRAIFDADLSDWFGALPDGLDHMITDLGRTLSPGLRKKITLARLYLRKSKIYFLDEPCFSLDLNGRKKLIARLNQFHDAGATLVLVSQDSEILSGASILVNCGLDIQHRVFRARIYDKATTFKDVSGPQKT
jgi:ATP-binding cassette subfamily C protein LapB